MRSGSEWPPLLLFDWLECWGQYWLLDVHANELTFTFSIENYEISLLVSASANEKIVLVKMMLDGFFGIVVAIQSTMASTLHWQPRLICNKRNQPWLPLSVASHAAVTYKINHSFYDPSPATASTRQKKSTQQTKSCTASTIHRRSRHLYNRQNQLVLLRFIAGRGIYLEKYIPHLKWQSWRVGSIQSLIEKPSITSCTFDLIRCDGCSATVSADNTNMLVAVDDKIPQWQWL